MNFHTFHSRVCGTPRRKAILRKLVDTIAIRTSEAEWRGGQGEIKLGSGAFNGSLLCSLPGKKRASLFFRQCFAKGKADGGAISQINVSCEFVAGRTFRPLTIRSGAAPAR